MSTLTGVNDSAALLTTFVSLALLFHRKLRISVIWHATITLLASIIGSGFLLIVTDSVCKDLVQNYWVSTMRNINLK